MINIEKLEKILIAKWAEFLDAREILSFAGKIAREHFHSENIKVHRMTITRFEFTEDGFILWLDCVVNLTDQNEEVNMTSEVYLLSNGLRHIQTI
jgi:hypothetical protein